MSTYHKLFYTPEDDTYSQEDSFRKDLRTNALTADFQTRTQVESQPEIEHFPPSNNPSYTLNILEPDISNTAPSINRPNESDLTTTAIQTSDGLISSLRFNSDQTYKLLSESEMKLSYSKFTLLFLVWNIPSALTACLIFYHNSNPLGNLFMLALCYFGVMAFFDLFWTSKLLKHLLDTDHLFSIYDILSCLISLLVIYSQALNLLSFSPFTSIPCFITTILYLTRSQATGINKVKRAIIRIFYALQTLIITLKLDGVNIFEWADTFVLIWILTIVILIDITQFTLLLAKELDRIELYLAQESEINAKIMSLSWYLLFEAISVVLFISFIGMTEIIDPSKQLGLLVAGLLLGIGVTVSFFMCELIFVEEMIKFMISFSPRERLPVAEDETQIESLESLSIIEMVTEEVRIKRKEKRRFFVMVSSTYFVPLHKSFRIKDKQALEKIKKNSDSKYRRFSQIFPSNNEEQKENPHIEGVIKTKSKLNRSFDGIEKKNEECAISVKSSSEEGNLCYICCINKPNIIFLCGHGGICLRCTTILVKERKDCTECRRKIKAFYKIGTQVKLGNIVTTMSVYKICRSKKKCLKFDESY